MGLYEGSKGKPGNVAQSGGIPKGPREQGQNDTEVDGAVHKQEHHERMAGHHDAKASHHAALADAHERMAEHHSGEAEYHRGKAANAGFEPPGPQVSKTT